jgi:hypothetical protein
MEKKFNKIFSFFVLSFLLSGCFFTSTPSKVECLDKIENKYGNLCEKYSNNYKCAIGVGFSQDEALKDAKRKLAESVFTVVESTFSSKIERELNGDNSNVTVGKIEWSSLNLTYLELENVKTLKVGKEDNCYYAVLLWDKKEAKKAVDDFKRKADAIMYVNLIEKVKDINLKLKLLIKLDRIVTYKHLENDTVSVNNSTVTFQSYIDSTLNNLINKLTIAFTRDKFYLITKDKFLPIKNVKVILKDINSKEETFVSSEDGSVYVPYTFSLPINVYLTLTERKVLIGTLTKKYKSVIYISTKPEGLVYNLYEDGTIISTGVTPNKVEVYPKSYERYKIVLPATKKFRRVEESLEIKRGFDAYFFREMERVKYGKVNLKADGDALLDINGADGRLIAEGVKEYKDTIPVGTYKVTVREDDDSYEYQEVTDTINVFENEEVKREYFEPRNREFYREGYGISLGFTTLLPSKLKKNGKTYEDDEFNRDKYEEQIMFLGFRKYYTHLFFGGDIGIAGGNNSDSSYNTDIGYFLDALIGIYTPFDAIKGSVELDLGYAYLSSSYDDAWNDSRSYDLEYSGGFIGLKLNFLSFFGLEIRRYQDETKFLFSLGFSSFKSGYRYPRYINALEGRDYK